MFSLKAFFFNFLNLFPVVVSNQEKSNTQTFKFPIFFNIFSASKQSTKYDKSGNQIKSTNKKKKR